MAKEIEVSQSVHPVAKIESVHVVRKNLAEMASYTPGSAIIYKGEPSATELGMLRFNLTTEDLKRVNIIVAEIMKRHENLQKSGERAVSNHVDAVVERIRREDLAVPFVTDSSAPEDRHSTEAKPQDVPERSSKFAQLLRRLDLRRNR